MGIHRCVIHPKFGSFVLLGTILLANEIVFAKRTLDYNPCLGCKLCVAVCPVQAIAPNGAFNFSACYNHNYREFLSGFVDWVETIADSKTADEYSTRVALHETTSMWQSLSFKPSHKAAFCLAVCPAGEDVLSPFLEDATAYVERYVKPLQDKKEDVYVLDGSDAQETLHERFPNKRAKIISWMHLDPSGPNLLFTMRLHFEAAKVWRDHIKPRGQRGDISMPPPPEFRPTVEKDQGLPVSLAHIVHVEVVDLSKQVVPVAVGAGLIASPRHRVTQPPEKGKT